MISSCHFGTGDQTLWGSATLAARAIFTPEAWREEDGIIVVDGVTVGEFPGSPLAFTFRFQLRGEAISGLEIA